MSPMDTHATGPRRTRRRGAELEGDILGAAWEQLTSEGHEHFTIDAVAARARTSRPVLYRRWKTREELLRATIRHRGTMAQPQVPDTGSLRGDLLAVLADANTRRVGDLALLSAMLGTFFDGSGPSLAEFRAEFIGGRTTSLEAVIGRAVERGEIDADRLTPRIASLPFDLLRHEVLMTLRPVPDHVLRQIVDDIFIPLVAAAPHQPTR
jgi:AcrR family transcriptional regulator